MRTYADRERMIGSLRVARRALAEAGQHALERDDGRSGLVGATAMTIGGLEQTVASLADLLEEDS